MKKGYDVNGALTAIQGTLYNIEYEHDIGETVELVFPEGSILTGEGSKPTLYNGVLGFLAIGDTKRIESSMRNKQRWGYHDGVFLVVVAGENDTAKKKANDIGRLVEIAIDENPTMETTGLMVTIPEENPFIRRKITFDKESKTPEWNSAVIINMEVRIARLREEIFDGD